MYLLKRMLLAILAVFFLASAALADSTVPIMAALTIPVSAASSSTSIADLGRPTSAVVQNANFPLSGFHRIKLTPAVHGRVRMVFLGAGYDERSGAERWPLVKALAQFGTFRNLLPARQVCGKDPRVVSGQSCLTPTYDMSHVQFASQYVVLDYRDLLNAQGQATSQPSRFEVGLFNRYSRTLSKQSPFSDAVQASVNSQQTSRTLPIVVAGNYLQTLSQTVFTNDFEVQQPVLHSPGTPVGFGPGGTAQTLPTGLPFDVIQAAPRSAHDPTASNVVEDVNAEANVISALICHADGGRPASVCGRSVIKRIGRHVR